MRLAIISDIHANLDALRAVLAEIDRRGVDAIYCLGDIVGYGAEPGACVDLVRERCAGVVLGNHDEAVAKYRGLRNLPRDAQKAVCLHHEMLSGEQRRYLSSLPLKLAAHGCTMVHASPDRPHAWRRLHRPEVLGEQFYHFNTEVCFVGHSHIPDVVTDSPNVLRVRPGHRFLINVGSVGQPRDGDPRACVAFFDTDTFDYEAVRLPYDIEEAARKIRALGLSAALAARLFAGT